MWAVSILLKVFLITDSLFPNLSRVYVLILNLKYYHFFYMQVYLTMLAVTHTEEPARYTVLAY
jgi:hypothetical protein